MMNKDKGVNKVSGFLNKFRCPICKHSMQLVREKSLICSNKHTFDMAKQGYVNMMTRATNSHYDKALFEARQKIITESTLYTSLHEHLAEVVNRYVDASTDSALIIDAGCGEGSHLQRIVDRCNHKNVTGVGVDIAKEAIVMAAKNYTQPMWIVGDVASSPLADQSCHVILNILSPANYAEFKRMLIPKGVLIKVVPGTNYLKELREAVLSDNKKKQYNNDHISSLFQQHFELAQHCNVSYTRKLSQPELMNLVQMSPLAWNSKKECFDRFTSQEFANITVDLDVMVGVS